MYYRAGEITVPVTELEQLPLVLVVPAGIVLAVLSLVAYAVKKRR